MNLFNKKSQIIAFTLAEVLITLGIIGIVAELTIPTVVSSFKKQETAVEVKKFYTTLAQTFEMSFAKNGPLQIETSSQVFFNESIKPYLKIINECNHVSGCWADDVKTLNNGSLQQDQGNIGVGSSGISFQTIDGFNVAMDYYNGGTPYYINTENLSSTQIQALFVDINGDKKPNIVGRDIFAFVLMSENGRWVPAGYGYSQDKINASCSKTGNGVFCSSKLVSDGWQIKDDYPW